MLENQNDTLRLIPLLPLASAVIAGVWLAYGGKPMRRWTVIGLCCSTPFLAFLIAFQQFLSLIQLPEAQRYFVDNVYTWISVDPFHVFSLGYQRCHIAHRTRVSRRSPPFPVRSGG